MHRINNTNKPINGKMVLVFLNSIGTSIPNGTNARRLPRVKIHSFKVSIEKCLGIHKGIRSGINQYRYSRVSARWERPNPKNMKYTNKAI